MPVKSPTVHGLVSVQQVVGRPPKQDDDGATGCAGPAPVTIQPSRQSADGDQTTAAPPRSDSHHVGAGEANCLGSRRHVFRTYLPRRVERNAVVSMRRRIAEPRIEARN